MKNATERSEQPERPEAADGSRAQGTIATTSASAAPAAPRTSQELAALRRQRDETTQQLSGTHRRRAELVEEMRQTIAGDQQPLRAQMSELDRRVLLLETDLTNVDHLIATAPPGLAVEAAALRAVTAVQPRGFLLLGPDGPSPNAVPALLLLITLLQLALLIRSRVRRAPHGPQPDAIAREAVARLARVEQAVDAIAVEVERVSEGQRYVTRVLGEQGANGVRLPAVARPRSPTPS